MNHIPSSKALSLALLAVWTACSCTLAPRHEHPSPPLPAEWNAGAGQSYVLGASQESASYPEDTPSQNTRPESQGEDWRGVIVDPSMAGLVELALTNNRDLRVAVARIEKARAQHAIARADLVPHIGATGKADMSRTPAPLSYTGEAYTSHTYSAGVGITSFEVDLFGRVRSLRERALEQFLSTVETTRGVHLALVAEVGQAYLTLAAQRERLALARRTLETERITLALERGRWDHGMSSERDVARAAGLMNAAQRDVAERAESVTAAENTLALLLGMPLTDHLAPAQALDNITPFPPIPAGLPSEVLARRPDVRAAEHDLKAANADIGAARARYFPRIGLTASYGNASMEMDDLFGGGTRTWSFVPQATLPLFHAGAIRAGVEAAEAERDIRVAQYEKAVQGAFREVSDTLARRTSLKGQVEAQAALVSGAERSLELATQRYEAGLDSSLDRVDAQRTETEARQQLVALRLARQSNALTLFKVLGGGWPRDTHATMSGETPVEAMSDTSNGSMAQSVKQ